MITGSIIELLWLLMSCFVPLSPPYCTNGLLNLPVHIQLSVRKPSLLWKVVSLWTAYSVAMLHTVWNRRWVCKGPVLSHEQKHSVQRRDSWCWTWRGTQKADAGVGAGPTCAGDQGPGWCAWTEGEKCLLFRCEFQMGGRAIKSKRPELSLKVKAWEISTYAALLVFWGNTCLSYTPSSSGPSVNGNILQHKLLCMMLLKKTHHYFETFKWKAAVR